MERIMKLALVGKSGWDRESATAANGWDLVTESLGWQVFAHKPRDRPSAFDVHEYLALGSMKTSIAALQEAFYVKNTYDFRALSALLYEDAILDAALLNLTHSRTDEDPGQFFGVKYLKLSVQVMNMEDQEQEYIYLEFSGTRLDAQGRRTFFCITDPVSIRPLDNRRTKLTYGERCSTVKLYRETLHGTVDVVVRAKLQSARSTGPTPATQSSGRGASNQGAANMVQLCKTGYLVYWRAMGMFIPGGLVKDLTVVLKEASAPEARRLTTGPFAANWNAQSKACIMCQKGFNLLRRKHYCRRCGEAMCKSCAVGLYCVDRPTKSKSSSALAKEKFCKACFVAAKIEATRGPVRKTDTGTVNTIIVDDDDGSSGSGDSLQHRDIVHVHIFFYTDSGSSRSGSVESDPLHGNFEALSLRDGPYAPSRRLSVQSVASTASVSSSVFDVLNAVRLPPPRRPPSRYGPEPAAQPPYDADSFHLRE
ncbi:hypothetical protein ACHHYP_09547 [Achlya hypogyna]|uniref:FYVE-type domain-containing protein n=1 Tax=Achlya hypogyna TaxID=1202772 RepID=A0A1V9YN43_ACHHY|nr:hypothetical protein ACHHYP_09547 [Achlya hypogyna]